MPALTAADRSFARALQGLSYCNPFLPERIEYERAALGDRYAGGREPWNLWPGHEVDDPNILALRERAEAIAKKALAQWSEPGRTPDDGDAALYEDLILFMLFHRYELRFQELIDRADAGRLQGRRVAFWNDFHRDAERFFAPTREVPSRRELPHVFALFFQIRRAFRQIFYFIVGTSRPTARLRAAVWQSIFSHDLGRYRRSLHRRMADFTTLVTGPSGTGKELVARAIGLARYIPFDADAGAFTGDVQGSFHELNLSALSPTLIESELFGHRRGAFTGAVSDRKGWLEACAALGTVFLDEIGDLDPTLQVKLLRVVQTRDFQRLGETRSRRFDGKVIAATHRDLADEMQAGRFREDLYYRLCSDIVEVPSLAERLRDDPAELDHLVRFIARREVGEDADEFADEVQAWIDGNLGREYPWPGNVRELEQCLRNVLLRKHYRPRTAPATDARRELAEAVAGGKLTAAELLNRYTTQVWLETGNYEETARRLGLDRRTVKARIDPDWQKRLES